MLKSPLLMLALLAGTTLSTQAAEVKLKQETQKSVGITIYNNNLAAVRDVRALTLPAGQSTLEIEGVSGQMRPETALLAGGGFQVQEQNFDFDLLTAEKLLEKAVGQIVRVARVNPATGEETIEQAEVLANNGGPVLKIGDRIETGIPGRIIFDKIPENLRAKPTLSLKVDAAESIQKDVELTYLSGGLGWQADYVANLNPDETEISLQGWVTLTNQSGTSFENAEVQLVAGDVNQVQEIRAFRKRAERNAVMLEDAMGASPVQQEALFEYHLYTLPNRTSVANNQTKQVGFIKSDSVEVKKILESRGDITWWYNSFQGGKLPKQNPTAFIEFENKEDDGLGKPLPMGTVRVYKEDSRGLSQFVGEDRIKHTAKNEEVRLKLGESFDVSVFRTQLDFEVVSKRVVRSRWEIRVKNAKDEPVTVRIVETPTGDWKILEESAPHTKEAAFLAVWPVTVEPEGETVLTYQVEAKY